MSFICQHPPWAICELGADHPGHKLPCRGEPLGGATLMKPTCGALAERKCEECELLLCREHGPFQDEIDTQKLTV